jgi:hypothetical protein
VSNVIWVNYLYTVDVRGSNPCAPKVILYPALKRHRLNPLDNI